MKTWICPVCGSENPTSNPKCPSCGYRESGGTPKDLDEAIQQAVCIGPMSDIKERSYAVMKDFIANKFCNAYLGATEEQMLVLKPLYEKLTRRGCGS